MNKINFEQVSKVFDEYYENYKHLSNDIDYKYTHSYNVSKLMGDLAKRLGLDENDVELAKTIGLLHDIGRFEQLKTTGSFNDKEFDHAIYGGKLLFEDKFIEKFIDFRDYDELINFAIVNHNKFAIDECKDERVLMFAKMIRDMDKTDIYYQIAMKYSPEFDGNVTKKVLDDFMDGKCINHKDRKTKSDKLVSEMAFLNDFNFNESLDLLVETDNFGLFLSTVDVKDDAYELFSKLRTKCYEIINRGV